MSDVTVFDKLIGKTCTKVERPSRDMLVFRMEDGDDWFMYHPQDCCEYVALEEVVGDLTDLEGSPLLMAELTTDTRGSNDWSFYKFRTHKGDVTLRWCGDNESYYSIEVSFLAKSTFHPNYIPWDLREFVK